LSVNNKPVAPLAAPAFTGIPTAPTAAVGTNTFQLATTAFVTGAAGNFLPKISPIVSDGLVYLRSDGNPELLFQNAAGSLNRSILYHDSTNHRNVWQLYVTGNNAVAAGFVIIDQTGTFTASGNIAANSDAKLKTNVKTIDNALSKVSALRGVTFDRIDTGKAGLGLIAQEAQKVIPELVHEDTKDGTLSISYGNIVGLLVEAVKELRAEVIALKAR
jgi:hypothetical protein